MKIASFSLSKNIAQMIGDHKNLWCTTPYKMGENAAETGLIQHNLQHLKNATILAEVQPELAYNDPNVRGGNPARLWFDTIIYRQPPSDPDDFVNFLNNAKHMLSPGGEIHAFKGPSLLL
ncbi:hypothetical protein QVD17_11320 [Tagetes erecta]|uniref:Uncharacterized protein n=1 Tax=Tagetes erecta TaxID=13708 RepID=A0AAD8KU83_TARER|nr:hypothetical protein QVD17_11320 [Tagetes erecta]